MFEEGFWGLPHEPPAPGDLLRLVLRPVRVCLLRVCDGGRLLPRARLTLKLGGIVPGTKHVPAMERLLTRVLTLDLFEPPQRERIRKEVVRLAAEGLEQRQIALQLPQKATHAAVSKAYVL